MEKLLSIVLPVYNAEKYIAECLDSIFVGYSCEIFNRVEVLAINDCSKDKSAEILEKYAGKYPLTVYTNEKNLGASSTRNVGMRKATGRYIWLAENDDKLLPHAIEKACAELDAYPETDLLQFGMVHFRSEKQGYKQEKCCGCKLTTENGQKVFSEYVKRGKYSAYQCERIVSKQLIEEHNIFEKEKFYWDDAEWSPRIFAFAEHVHYYPENLYAKRKRANSLGNEKRSRKHYFDQLLIISSLNEFMDNPTNNITPEFRDAVNHFLVSTLLTALSGILLEDGGIDEELLAEIKKYKYLLKYGSFKRKYIYPLLIKILGLKLFCKLRG